MGMAASQARFLQLTARKSNDEYQGQQINQARTALANKSAGLFEKMLGLVPPTPPSSMDDRYYTQGYGFTDPTDMLRKKITSVNMDVADAAITINALTYYQAGFTAASISVPATSTDFATLPTSAITGLNPHADTSKTELRYATFEHTAYDPNGNYVIYTEKRPIVAFYDKEERLLDFQYVAFTAAYNSDPTSPDYYDPGNDTTAASHNEGDPPVLVVDGSPPTFDNMIFTAVASPSLLKAKDPSIILTNDDTTYMNDLSYLGQFDDIAYQEAMDRYEFQKNAYDYQIERVNLETKAIQQQDKSLELKLKQIDTDHSAIQTEMDAVAKVITKNIESTFKTFA